MKKIILLSAIALLVLATTGCEKKEKSNNDKDMFDSMNTNIEIKNILRDDSIKILLDSVFSEKNSLLKVKKTNDVNIFVLNNENDFSEICKTGETIDFSNITIIGGIVKTNSISHTIKDVKLYQNDKTQKHGVLITVLRPSASYPAIGYLYFWCIYPKMDIQEVLYKIQYEES